MTDGCQQPPGWPPGYTYDPSTPAGMLRLRLGDIDPAWPLLSDMELQAMLDGANGNLGVAVFPAILAIIARLGAETSETVGSVSITGKDRMAAYEKLYDLLMSRIGFDGGMPYAGGISVSDNRTLEADADRAPKFFTKRSLDIWPKNRRREGYSETIGAGASRDPFPPDEDELP